MPQSLPQDFQEQMKAILNEEFPAFLEAMQNNITPSIRLNPLKSRPDFEGLVPVKWAQQAYYLKERPLFTADPHFHAGAYYVQESSSMFIEQILTLNIDLSKPLNVLDLCAAPGGKTTHIISLLHPDSLIIANEINPKRYQALQHNIAKWGYSNVWTSCARPDEYRDLCNFFDLIIVDAPCSGEGMMRKDEFAIQQWNLNLVNHCETLQKDILSETIPLLKDNGILIYSTCTFNRKENEGAMHFLKDKHCVPIQEVSGFPEIIRTEAEGITGYRFFPHRVSGEGFFITAVRKKYEEKDLPNKKLPQDPFWNKFKSEFDPAIYLRSEDFFFLEKSKTDIFAIRKHQMENWQKIKKIIRHLEPSLKVGQIKGKDMIPHAHLAWSNDLSSEIPAIELSLEEALEFLRRNNLFCEGGQQGWNMVRYRGNPLGWIKNLGNRWNNYYPARYKILHH